MKNRSILFFSILMLFLAVSRPILSQNESGSKIKKTKSLVTEEVIEDWENARTGVSPLTYSDIDLRPLHPEDFSYLDIFKHTIHSKILWRVKTAPNPVTVNQVLKVNILSPENNKWELYLMNSLGQTVYSNLIKSDEKLEINVQQFAAGVYFLVSTNGNEKQVDKIVIQN